LRSPAVASAMALIIIGCPAGAQTFRSSAGNIQVETVTTGLSYPWGLAFLPDGRMLVTERPGRMRLVARDGKLAPPLGGVPKVLAQSQGGLHDVALGSYRNPFKAGPVASGRLVALELVADESERRCG
jgi:aldose sugar dehydrogenase